VLPADRAHQQSEEVLEEACAALDGMTRGNAENQTRAVNAGAVEAVNSAMTTRSVSATVRLVATTLLQLLGVPPHDANAADAIAVDAEHEGHRLCIICYDKPRAHRFDCGHMTVCEECVMQLPLQAVPQQYRTAANARRRMRLCPTCRAPTEVRRCRLNR